MGGDVLGEASVDKLGPADLQCSIPAKRGTRGA
jgi:hypothetical protein